METVTVDSDEQTWATAILTNADNDTQFIFRYALTFSPTFDRATQPVRISIAWKYETAKGIPGTEDNERMTVLEDALESALEQDNFATLVLVATGGNLREWTYHAKSGAQFVARLNDALGHMPKFPIEIFVEDDPEWRVYQRFVAQVKSADDQHSTDPLRLPN
jgi:hypothetical protein